MRPSRPAQRGIWIGCAAIIVAFLVAPATGAPLVTFTAPYTAAADNYGHGTTVGGGANTVHVSPTFSLATGVGLESIESSSTTNAGTASADYVAHTGEQLLAYKCAGTCAGSYRATFYWDVKGVLSVSTTCTGGLGTFGTIFTQATISIRASVYDSTTSTPIGGGTSTVSFLTKNTCPASSSTPFTGAPSFGFAVSLTLGDTYWLNSSFQLETQASMTLGTGATASATADAVANFGSPGSNNVKLIKVELA